MPENWSAERELKNLVFLDDSILDLDSQDKKSLRSMSRSSIFLVSMAQSIAKQVEPLVNQNPFQVGFYCALLPGPVEQKCAKTLSSAPQADWASSFRSQCPPKLHLSMTASIAASHLNIFLKSMGPLNVYNDIQYACYHALNQAQWDLQNGKVRYAIVAAAFSHEDPLASYLFRKATDFSVPLCEGAALILLEKSEKKLSNERLLSLESKKFQYGIATPLIRACEEGVL